MLVVIPAAIMAFEWSASAAGCGSDGDSGARASGAAEPQPGKQPPAPSSACHATLTGHASEMCDVRRDGSDDACNGNGARDQDGAIGPGQGCPAPPPGVFGTGLAMRRAAPQHQPGGVAAWLRPARSGSVRGGYASGAIAICVQPSGTVIPEDGPADGLQDVAGPADAADAAAAPQGDGGVDASASRDQRHHGHRQQQAFDGAAAAAAGPLDGALERQLSAAPADLVSLGPPPQKPAPLELVTSGRAASTPLHDAGREGSGRGGQQQRPAGAAPAANAAAPNSQQARAGMVVSPFATAAAAACEPLVPPLPEAEEPSSAADGAGAGAAPLAAPVPSLPGPLALGRGDCAPYSSPYTSSPCGGATAQRQGSLLRQRSAASAAASAVAANRYAQAPEVGAHACAVTVHFAPMTCTDLPGC